MTRLIDKTLARFELKALLTDRLSLAQLLFWQWWLSGSVFGAKGVASPASADALLWANYGLFICGAVAVMMAGVCVGFTLVKPRKYRMVELMLASPLPLGRLITTTFSVCMAFSAGNLLLHLLVLRLRYGVVPYGYGFYAGLLAALSLAAFCLLGAVLLALRRRDYDQLHYVLIVLGMLLWAPIVFTHMRAQLPVWLAPSAAAFCLLGAAALWRSAGRLVSKEQAVLA